MSIRFEVLPQRGFDPELLRRLEDVFRGENLIQTILHAHLLIERAILAKLTQKFVRPDILDTNRWSFHQKLCLFVGLYGPSEHLEKELYAFNELRNKMAHKFQDEDACVAKILPWDLSKGSRPDALTHVFFVASQLLLQLDAVRGFAVSDF